MIDFSDFIKALNSFKKRQKKQKSKPGARTKQLKPFGTFAAVKPFSGKYYSG